MGIDTAKFIPWLPALGAVLCGLCCTHRKLRVWAAPISVLLIIASFTLTLAVRSEVEARNPISVFAFDWIHIGGLEADFAYLMDPLTTLMLCVVTGIGALVTIYACGYMAGDRGYARFFAGVSLFVFAMTTLVMADNLVLMYLGWEGVGLCSYLLIGYDYRKPSAVAAAKKAFIVNRVGDLGFALGVFLTYYHYGTVALWTGNADTPGVLEMAQRALQTGAPCSSADLWIPFLLMLGAFGKSAQFPLYVWLPDAMEGPTPVSALIHAATMVTAGVYMIARMLPLFELSPYALPTVATIGGLTALFAATIAMRQFDLKRVFAYSTISQLGYMFLGVGVLSTAGGIFHLFTHAFFKALLFLTAGNVMHALAGQLDMRKISGLRRKMPLTCILMFTGCIALAGVPYITAGFYSKDMIIAAALDKGIGEHQLWMMGLAGMAIVTAFLTAYYTFRLWFRVFMGPQQYPVGQEHDYNDKRSHETQDGNIRIEHHHEPHEMNWIMNGPLFVLAIGSIIAGFACKGWVTRMVKTSTAVPHGGDSGHGAATIFGLSTHTFMILVSFVVSLGGIGVAAYYHWLNRDAADRAAAAFPRIARILANKYYVDDLCDAVIVRPLRLLGELLYTMDRLIIDGIVALVGFIPRAAGLAAQTSQRGLLQGYGLAMVTAIAVVLVLVIAAMR